MKHDAGNWSVGGSKSNGNRYGAIVTDKIPEQGNHESRDFDDYGGYMIAESIASNNRLILARAPQLLTELKFNVARRIQNGDLEVGCSVGLIAEIEGWEGSE